MTTDRKDTPVKPEWDADKAVQEIIAGMREADAKRAAGNDPLAGMSEGFRRSGQRGQQRNTHKNYGHGNRKYGALW